jgi:hypothetical protein
MILLLLSKLNVDEDTIRTETKKNYDDGAIS